jgi:hypothetical protein
MFKFFTYLFKELVYLRIYVLFDILNKMIYDVHH